MKHLNPLARRILLSRLLTRSGDQAWDFAVPMTLVVIVPGGLRATALYFLAVRLSHVLLAPRIGSLIDRWQRLRCAAVGIGAQTFATLAGLGIVVSLSHATQGTESSRLSAALLVLLIGTGVISSLGSLIMDIAVANDIIPTAIAPEHLSAVNSRLRQIDLATEVGAPILTGVLLALSTAASPLLGFTIVACWNVVSFLPEYGLIRSVVLGHPGLRTKPLNATKSVPAPLSRRLTAGWRDFIRQPIMPAVVAYALLWLSVLSPHGVLLSAFLKDGWNMPEVTIGVFRGLGAVFGLASTFFFPMLERRLGLVPASRLLIIFQAMMVCLSAFAFGGSEGHQMAFLALILLSRIGLYGFSIGETQIRQLGIAEAERGRVNGFASAVTSIATLGLYGAGAIFSTPAEFEILVRASATVVTLAAVIFSVWSLQSQRSPELK